MSRDKSSGEAKERWLLFKNAAACLALNRSSPGITKRKNCFLFLTKSVLQHVEPNSFAIFNPSSHVVMGKWFKALNGMLCVRRKSSTSWVVLSIRACKILCPFWKVLYRCGIHLRQIISLTKWETYGSSRNRFVSARRETLFSFRGTNYCPYYLLDTSEHLYGYP